MSGQLPQHSASDVPPKVSDRTTRDWREVISALATKINDQLTPVDEGYSSLPGAAAKALRDALADLDDFDRYMARIDTRRLPAVGTEYVALIVRRERDD